jgi:hypothetical protein
MATNPDRTQRPRDERTAQIFDRILDALDGLRYGEVVVKVQDGVVVLVERTERLRVDAGRSRSG